MDEQDISGAPQVKHTLGQGPRPKRRLKVVQPTPLAIEAQLVVNQEELVVVNLWKQLQNLQRQEELERLKRKPKL